MEKMNLDGGRKDLRWSRGFQETNGYPKLICSSSKPISSISSIYTCSPKLLLKFAPEKKKPAIRTHKKSFLVLISSLAYNIFQGVTSGQRLGSGICFYPTPSTLLPLQVSCSWLFCHISSLSSCQM